jgi:ferredoxin
VAGPSSSRPVAIRVDRIRCDGYGMCAELLPELIELDDWGYPIVRPGQVPDELLAHATRAMEVCPVLAFRLQAVAAAEPARPAQPRFEAATARGRS